MGPFEAVVRAPRIVEQPRQLKHYEILSRIGSGGMGVVYRARDTRLGRTVALKVLHDELADDDERNRRFEREARIVSSISHPGIATVFDFDRDGATAFFAMELIDGSTLRELLRSGPLPPERVIDCGLQVAEALATAHRAGVIHRDLKPENVIAARSGYYKVLDFGVARADRAMRGAGEHGTQFETESWATSAGGLLGTVAYMSPEQALAEPIDARSDIFSLGSVLYELVTGQPPFRGNNAIATANAIVHEPHRPMASHRPGVPQGLELVVAKCLAKSPDERYRTAEDLAQDLRTLQLDTLAGGRSIRRLLAHRDSRVRRRKVVLVAAAASIVLALAALAALWTLAPRRAESPSGHRPADEAIDPLAVESERPRIIVAFFDNQTSDPAADWLGRGLAEMLTTDLSRSGDLEVIATQRLYDLAAMAKTEAPKGLDRSTVNELARWAGANLVITGSVFKLGETYRIDAQAHDTRTGTVRVARKVEGSDLFAMVDELNAGLHEDLRIGATSARAVRAAPAAPAPPRPVGTEVAGSTRSEKAFRLYTEGRKLYATLRFDEAAERFGGAVELDPDFALARLHLVLSQFAAGERTAAAGQAVELDRQAERLPESERLLAEGLRAILEDGDLAVASARLSELVERFPQQGEAYVVWAEALDELADDPVGATRKLRGALEQDPNNLPAIAALARHLARFGGSSDAARILRHAAERNPEAAAPLERYLSGLDEAGAREGDGGR